VRLIGGAFVAALVVAAIALGVVLTSTSSKPPATTGAAGVPAGSHPASLDHIQYVRLFESTVIGKTRISSLGRWPTPYQSYHDQYGHSCFEWWDKPNDLFNLCFTAKGLLWAKVVE